MNFQITDNFLDKESFNKLQKIIFDKEFSWFFRGTDTEIEGGYFTHSFFNDNAINCKFYYECMNDIFAKLDPKALIQVRANLMFSSLFYNKKSKWHIDYDYGNFTSILYLNTTEGGTEIDDDGTVKLVKAEANKLLTMKSNVKHRAILSPDVERRYIINLNYFKDKNNF